MSTKKPVIRIFFLLFNLVFILVVATQIQKPTFKELGDASLPTQSPKLANEDVKGEEVEKMRVIRVIDGDTIELSNSQIVRYIGIDAPETSKGEDCYSDEAKNKNEELVLGREIELEKDVSDKDKYGRLLRYVYISNPENKSDTIFVNDYLVREGYAKAISYPPDTTHSQELKQTEREAFEEGKGISDICYPN